MCLTETIRRTKGYGSRMFDNATKQTQPRVRQPENENREHFVSIFQPKRLLQTWGVSFRTGQTMVVVMIKPTASCRTRIMAENWAGNNTTQSNNNAEWRRSPMKHKVQDPVTTRDRHKQEYHCSKNKDRDVVVFLFQRIKRIEKTGTTAEKPDQQSISSDRQRSLCEAITPNNNEKDFNYWQKNNRYEKWGKKKQSTIKQKCTNSTETSNKPWHLKEQTRSTTNDGRKKLQCVI